MKRNKYKLFEVLLIIYLSLGPVAWFGYSTIGFYKRTILILLILTSITSIKIKYCKDLGVVLLAYLFLIFSLWINGTDSSPFLLISGLVENVLFFLIGFNSGSNNNYFKKSIPYSIVVLAFFCLLTIVNFITNVPDWSSPAMQMIEEEKNVIILEYDKLWQTGFSWSRSGWGISISLYLPLLMLAQKLNGRLFGLLLTSFSIILVSLVLCGNRSGLLGFIIASLFVLRNYDIAAAFKKYIKITRIVIPVIFIIYSPFFLKHFRFNSDDFSANRLDMYSYIPEMITSMKFWGMGDGSTFLLLNKMAGLNFQLHNTPIRSVIEYGWLYGFSIIYIMIVIVIRFLKFYKRDRELAVYGSILLSGIITSMFEPAAIFGYLGGYSLWWMAFGIFSFRYKALTLDRKYYR